MKTDALKAILSALQEYAGPLEEQEEEVLAAVAELTALETENAVKDAALDGLCRAIEQGDENRYAIAAHKGRAALSPPTGQVLVDVKKLRHFVEWLFYSTLIGTDEGRELHNLLTALLKDHNAN